jgi:hypothetical protein
MSISVREAESKVLFNRLLALLKEQKQIWRTKDAVRLIGQVSVNLSAKGNTSHRTIRHMLRIIQQMPQPEQQPVEIVGVDGSSYAVDIPEYFVNVGLLCCTPCSVLNSDVTIADVKFKLEEDSGILNESQVLFFRSAANTQELEDEDKLEPINGRDKGFLLVVDTERYYWRQHARMVQNYQQALVKGYSQLASIVQYSQPSVKVVCKRFLRYCRRVLSFMKQSRTCKPVDRHVEQIENVERLIKTLLLPMFDAVRSRVDAERGELRHV